MAKGRPALSGEPKGGRLIIRHTAEERAAMDSAAAVVKKPTSTWARDTLLQMAAFTLAQQTSPAAEGKAAKKPAGKKSPKKPKA